MEEYSTPILVSACALIGESGRILLQKRQLNGSHGGLWEFPGGKVEDGESPESALVRELEEELAIELNESDLCPITSASEEYERESGGKPLVILLYSCRAWRGEPRCLVGEEIAWFDPISISNLPMPPLDYPLAEGLLEAIKSEQT